MTVNVAALRAGLAAVEAAAERGEWNQRRFRCNTGMCYAGWVAQIHSGQWAGRPDHILGEFLTVIAEDEPDMAFRLHGKFVVTAKYRATRLLGISYADAGRLFSAHNDLATLRQLVADLIEHGTLASADGGDES